MSDTPKTGLALLREPFPANLISKLPKGTKSQNECPADEKKNCNICGGWHHPQIKHLDYVGHAALTHRLLDVDPAWTWEPAGIDAVGNPVFDSTGGLWIRLTVLGVTRLGYGNADSKPYMDKGAREKECIGDALRNAAMRFGAALDLWHKGDLHAPEDDDGGGANKRPAAAPASQDMSPKARADRIMTGVAAGDAAGAADVLSRLGQEELASIWEHITADYQQKLTLVWPK